jgi:hypothetical protein
VHVNLADVHTIIVDLVIVEHGIHLSSRFICTFWLLHPGNSIAVNFKELTQCML